MTRWVTERKRVRAYPVTDADRRAVFELSDRNLVTFLESGCLCGCHGDAGHAPHSRPDCCDCPPVFRDGKFVEFYEVP